MKGLFVGSGPGAIGELVADTNRMQKCGPFYAFTIDLEEITSPKEPLRIQGFKILQKWSRVKMIEELDLDNGSLRRRMHERSNTHYQQAIRLLSSAVQVPVHWDDQDVLRDRTLMECIDFTAFARIVIA